MPLWMCLLVAILEDSIGCLFRLIRVLAMETLGDLPSNLTSDPNVLVEVSSQ